MATARALEPALVPPLQSGDRMTSAEFHRRYEDRPDVKKAELVEGVVYVPSSVSAQYHAGPHAALNAWLGAYWATNAAALVGDNATVVLDADNQIQPDILLRRISDGSSRISDEGYIEGPPELVVEVAASSASYDLHQKKHVYRRSGVQEYIVWRVYDGEVDWFSLEEGEYQLLQADDQGVIQSKVFPGLRLNVEALLSGDLAGRTRRTLAR